MPHGAILLHMRKLAHAFGIADDELRRATHPMHQGNSPHAITSMSNRKIKHTYPIHVFVHTHMHTHLRSGEGERPRARSFWGEMVRFAFDDTKELP